MSKATHPGDSILAGRSPAQPGAHFCLAIRLFDHVRTMGFSQVALACSTVAGSLSRYLSFHDSQGHRWKIRISNHRMPVRAEAPHLDLVSFDGHSGFDEATAWIARCAAGELSWFDATLTWRRLSRRQNQRNWKRWA